MKNNPDSTTNNRPRNRHGEVLKSMTKRAFSVLYLALMFGFAPIVTNTAQTVNMQTAHAQSTGATVFPRSGATTRIKAPGLYDIGAAGKPKVMANNAAPAMPATRSMANVLPANALIPRAFTQPGVTLPNDLFAYMDGNSQWMTGSNGYGDTKYGYVFKGTGGKVYEVYAYLLNGYAGDVSDIYAELYTVGANGLPETLLGTSNPVSTDDVPDDYTLILFTFSSPVTVPVDFAAVITVPAYTGANTDIIVCSSGTGTVIAGDEALPVSYGTIGWETMISAWGTTELFDLAIFPVVTGSETINLADYTGATAVANVKTAIDAALAVHSTVYVVNNSATAFDAGSNALTINIPSGKKVEWNAAYVGATTSSYLLNLSGAGTFEVKDSSITQKGSGAAIGTSTGVPVIVSGGAVSAASGYGIYSAGNVTVSGGTVSSATGDAIYGNNITVSGGVVHSTTGFAIRAASGSAVNVSGGFVFSYGTGITGTNNVIEVGGGGTLNITSLGVVAAWNEAAGRTTYYAGASADLSVDPAGTAVWGMDGTKSGIVYTNGANTGFFELPVTVRVVSDIIDLADFTTVAAIQADIAAALEIFNTVYVKKSTNGAFNADNNILAINIPASKKVEWNAAYEGSVASNYLLNLTGTGTFEVTGGSITQNGTNVTAIYTNSAVSITVSGGAVSAASGYGIYSTGSVTVSGGTVSSATGHAIYGNNITVSGGTVSSGTGDAIHGNNQVTVSGGVVHSTTGNAIINAGGTTNVSGGFVFAYGTGITGVNNVIYLAGGTLNITSLGVVVAWDKTQNRTTYAAGASTDLIFEPAGTAKWGIENGKSGIRYTNGANTGFFEISGITVKEVSNTIDLKDYSFVSDIEEGIHFALTAHNTVYVENTSGSAYNAGNANFTLTIVNGETVEWNADYRGAISSDQLIRISTSGTGLFKVTGGSIANTSTSAGNAIYTSGNVEVSGGTVSVAGTGSAISIGGNGAYTITVSGGTVLSTNGSAIYSTNSNASSSVTVSGGFVFAHGSAIDNVIYMASGSPTLTGNGVVVAWNQAAGTTTYTEGTTDHLVFEPAGATVVWSTDAMLGDGISYSYNGNTGFFALPVTVNAPLVPVSVNPSGVYAFPTETYGYDHAALVRQFTITNTGTAPITRLVVSLGASSDFEISSALSTTTVASGGTATFSIRPKAGLSVNASPHADVLTIRWAEDDGTGLTVNLSFTVNPKAITVTANSGQSTYGQSPSNPGISAAGLVYGESVSVLTGLKNNFNINATTSPASYSLEVIGNLTNSNYIVTARYMGIWRVYKVTGAAVSGVPTLRDLATADLITVSAVTIPNNPGNQTVEYAISASLYTGEGMQNTLQWQSGTTFTGPFAEGTYYVYARSAANEYYAAGTAQISDAIVLNLTGIDDVQPAKSLIAWVQNDRLYVSGLTSGKPWSVYNISGMLIYQSIAENDKADISLPFHGVYIVRTESEAVKTKN